MTNTLTDNTKAAASHAPNQVDDEIDLGELLGTLLENKWLIITIMLLALIIGVTKAFLDTPIYKADAMLQVEEHSQSLSALEPIAGLLESKVPVLAEIQIIKSRMILGEAVKNLNLEIIAKPKYLKSIGEFVARRFQQRHSDQVSSPFMGMEQYAWGGEVIKIDSLTVPTEWIGKNLILVAGKQRHFKLMDNEELILEGEVGEKAGTENEDPQQEVTLFVSQLKARPNTHFIVKLQSLREGIGQLQQNLTVNEKGKNTGILNFTMESPNPSFAAQALNEITNIYVRLNVEQKSEEAKKTLDFLDRQLPIIKEQLEAATTALNEYRMSKGSIDLNTETQGILTSVVEIRTQITLLQQKRDDLRRSFTPSHPSVIAIDKQIGRLLSQMAGHNKKIEALPETQQVILRLSRDVKVNTGLYTTLLNNAQTLRVAKAGTVGDVRIIDDAILPTSPIKPKKSLIIAVSGVLGLIVGIASAFIRKSFHRGIKDPDLIEKQLNVPVYATIPHSKRQDLLNSIFDKSNKEENNSTTLLASRFKEESDATTILAHIYKEDLAIESLRSLRTTLHFAFLEAKNNIIMISGPSPGIGKTFVSVNLATVLADAGKKILLIDGDLRKGTVNKMMGVSREKGLSELITKATTAEEAIRKITPANIDFIPTGTIPPNPSELLLHEHFGELLKEFSNHYDHIIIDSPPILAVTDACIIGRLASVTLMVVKAGEHPMRELEQSVKRLTQSGVSLKGIVFNDLPETSTQYGYGKYVYHYSYQKTT
jgi:tyrosine-protein kinase Etk/Wzc